MEQLIKKVNMIDILGMLLPGGLMLLLLEQDIHWIRDLSSYLGINAGNILMIMIFLCGSYAVGMLLHELGSVIEKLMWENPILDPHMYAAISTKLVTRYAGDGKLKNKEELERENKSGQGNEVKPDKKGEQEEDKKLGKTDEQEGDKKADKKDEQERDTKPDKKEEHKKETERGKIRERIAKFCGKMKKISEEHCKNLREQLKQILKGNWKKCCAILLKSLPVLLLGAVVLGIIPMGVSIWNHYGIVEIVILICFLSFFIQKRDLMNVAKAYLNLEQRTLLKQIKKDRVLIEGNSDTTEENARKRGLFNGYYAMARSLIIVMALLQCYAWLQPEGNESSFMQLVEKINANPAYLFLWVMVALLLMGRYWHFVRTRFSYTYHGFIYNKDNPKKLDVKEITHIGVIGSDNQTKDTLEIKRFLE